MRSHGLGHRGPTEDRSTTMSHIYYRKVPKVIMMKDTRSDEASSIVLGTLGLLKKLVAERKISLKTSYTRFSI